MDIECLVRWAGADTDLNNGTVQASAQVRYSEEREVKSGSLYLREWCVDLCVESGEKRHDG